MLLIFSLKRYNSIIIGLKLKTDINYVKSNFNYFSFMMISYEKFLIFPREISDL
jgi:hypothetical protein